MRYTDTEQKAIYYPALNITIPNSTANRAYRKYVIPYLNEGNVIAEYKEDVQSPETLPIIEGSTDTEKLDSVISVLRSKGIAL
jgi:hypothetical protein